jgi:diamine N-acetyltransferase
MLEQLRIERLASEALTADLLELLVNLSTQTFVETFGTNYTTANLTQYLQERLSPERLHWELTQEPNSFFYLVYSNAKVAGYLKLLSPCTKHLEKAALPITTPHATFLERFYFSAAFQGQGLAAVALSFACSLAKTKATPFIYLSVWENNLKAQRFYQNAGFKIFGETLYPVGQQNDREFLYGKTL